MGNGVRAGVTVGVGTGNGEGTAAGWPIGAGKAIPPPANVLLAPGRVSETPPPIPCVAARAIFCASFLTASASGVRLIKFAPVAAIVVTAAVIAGVGADDAPDGAYGLAGFRLLTRLIAASSWLTLAIALSMAASKLSSPSRSGSTSIFVTRSADWSVIFSPC